MTADTLPKLLVERAAQYSHDGRKSARGNAAAACSNVRAASACRPCLYARHPIFHAARWGLVGALEDILPQLVAALEAPR